MGIHLSGLVGSIATLPALLAVLLRRHVPLPVTLVLWHIAVTGFAVSIAASDALAADSTGLLGKACAVKARPSNRLRCRRERKRSEQRLSALLAAAHLRACLCRPNTPYASAKWALSSSDVQNAAVGGCCFARYSWPQSAPTAAALPWEAVVIAGNAVPAGLRQRS